MSAARGQLSEVSAGAALCLISVIGRTVDGRVRLLRQKFAHPTAHALMLDTAQFAVTCAVLLAPTYPAPLPVL